MVAMCLWNRVERLEVMAASLAEQEYEQGIDLVLWNNRRGDARRYNAIVNALELRGALRSVRLVHSPVNLGSIARFYFAREWHRMGHAPRPFVVVDDDENLPREFVATAVDAFRPRAVAAFWAFVVGDSYADRSPAAPGASADHIGPGGSVSDSSIYTTEFFTRLPERYWLYDDAWLSHWGRHHGIALTKLDVDIEFVLDETNQYHTVFYDKIEFHALLTEHGLPGAGESWPPRTEGASA